MSPTERGDDAIVITGVGAVTPLGVGARTLFEGWLAGRCGIRQGTARCSEFDPAEHLSRRELRVTDRSTQLALVATEEAVKDAGWDQFPPAPPEGIASVIGTSFGLTALEALLDRYRKVGPEKVSPHGITQVMSNAGAAWIAIKHGWQGESLSIGAGCAAGVQAIGAGVRMLQAGSAHAVVVGASDSSMTPFLLATYEVMGATSRSGVCRPYDSRRDGFIPGEGAGIMTLERAGAASARGARVLAEISGYAATNDSYHLAAPHPEGRGLAAMLRSALQSSGFGPEAVDYINPHGASTPLGDRVEVAALEQVFGSDARAIPVSSTKSTIGHLQNAAGAVEAVATVLSLQGGIAAHNIGLEQVDPELKLDFVTEEPVPIEDRGGKGFRTALAFSFGLGGHNAAIVMRTAEEAEQ